MDKEKVLLFRENQPKFAKWQGIDCLFVENTQSLFEKGKTDVQGAENQQVKQIDMAQMSNCDKIKVRLKTRGDRKKAVKPRPHWLERKDRYEKL